MRTIMGLAGCKKADFALSDTLAVRVIGGESGRVLLAVGDKTVSLDFDEVGYIIECLNATVKQLGENK